MVIDENHVDTILPYKIKNSQSLYDYAIGFWSSDIHIYESVFLILLSRVNDIIGYAKISQGARSSSTVDVALIAKYAVDTMSSAVVLVHNHPSGAIRPSNIDKKIIIKLKSALKLFDIDVLDNLIIAKDNYYSFADNGEII